jgi:ferredoxin
MTCLYWGTRNHAQETYRRVVLRGLMAAKNGPKAPIPASQGAAMLTVVNWPRIRVHLAAFPEDKWPGSCIGCGECANVCPQRIDIPEIMKKFAAMIK